MSQWFPGAAALVLAGLAAPAAAEISFRDMSGAIGLSQSYEGDWTHFVGGGVAVVDCNDDTLPDMLTAGGTAPTRLYVNTSTPGGDISFDQAPFDDPGEVIGAYPIDIDGDLRQDLIILRKGANLLLRGQDDCRFTPAPANWGFDGGNEWTTAFSATWEAGQNWPTLAFGNYVDQENPDGPFEACDLNYLHRPAGPQGWGARQPLDPGFCALSMLFSDWRRIGTADLRISNDRHYYVRGGREQMWHLSPLAEYDADDGWPNLSLWGMGIASRDLTGDGLPEVMLTSMGDQLLQFNRGGGVMENAPYSLGATATRPYSGDDGRASTGWHAEFGDIDNDGRDDLFIAKGNVEEMPSNAMADPNNLLIQQADGSFVEMGGITGIGTTERSRGAAVTDLNGDGRLDLIVVNRRAPLEIWQNTTTGAGHWLALDPRQPGANAHAVGAIVEVRLPDGRILTQERTIGGGHASGDAGPLHFGLGAAETVQVRVTSPGGAATDWAELATNRALILRQDGAGLRAEEY